MAKAVESRGIACCVSYSAGTFVCNAALYTGLYLSSRRYRFMKCCFIHVPYDETMEEALAGQPFMKRETLTEALTAAAGEAARALKAGKKAAISRGRRHDFLTHENWRLRLEAYGLFMER